VVVAERRMLWADRREGVEAGRAALGLEEDALFVLSRDMRCAVLVAIWCSRKVVYTGRVVSQQTVKCGVW